MGFLRFRRTFKILPGLKLNINKRSVGLTLGIRGAHFSVNTKGQKTTSIGIPGSGLSYISRSSMRANNRTEPTPDNLAISSTLAQGEKAESAINISERDPIPFDPRPYTPAWIMIHSRSSSTPKWEPVDAPVPKDFCHRVDRVLGFAQQTINNNQATQSQPKKSIKYYPYNDGLFVSNPAANGKAVTNTSTTLIDIPDALISYVNDLHELSQGLREAHDNIVNLVNSLTPAPPNWEADFAKQIVALLILASRAESVEPPEALQNAHKLFTSAVRKYRRIATKLPRPVYDSDNRLVKKYMSRMASANRSRAKALELVHALYPASD